MITSKSEKKTCTNCPIATASCLIGDMWVILLVRDLLKGPKRFGELQQSLIASETSQPINTRTLTDRLKLLEKLGIVNRIAHQNEMPPRVEYSLTPKGKALSNVIKKIKEYGEKYLTEK